MDLNLLRSATLSRAGYATYFDGLRESGDGRLALALWDAAPMLPIIEMAGCVFTTLDGERTHRGPDGVATNAALARELRALYRGAGES